jgi:hypothetical protein
MRFVLATLDHARAGAKALQVAVGQSCGIDANLGRCQAAVAAALGYASWAELKAETSRPGRVPSQFDAQAGADVGAERSAHYRRAYREHFGLTDEQASVVDMAVPLTAGSQPGGLAPIDLRYKRGMDITVGSVTRKVHIDFDLRLEVPELRSGLVPDGTFVAGDADARPIQLYRHGDDLYVPLTQRKGTRLQDAANRVCDYGDSLLTDDTSHVHHGLPWGFDSPEAIVAHLGARIRDSLVQRLAGLAWSGRHGLVQKAFPHYYVDLANCFFYAAVMPPLAADLPNCFGSRDDAVRHAHAFADQVRGTRPKYDGYGELRLPDWYRAPDFAVLAVRGLVDVFRTEAITLPSPVRQRLMAKFERGVAHVDKHPEAALTALAEIGKDGAAVGESHPCFAPIGQGENDPFQDAVIRVGLELMPRRAEPETSPPTDLFEANLPPKVRAAITHVRQAVIGVDEAPGDEDGLEPGDMSLRLDPHRMRWTIVTYAGDHQRLDDATATFMEDCGLFRRHHVAAASLDVMSMTQAGWDMLVNGRCRRIGSAVDEAYHTEPPTYAAAFRASLGRR